MQITSAPLRAVPVHAALLCAFAFLFSLRVFGQALQRWAPQPFLPPFERFQGSNLPYGFLLLIQLVLLAVMTRVAWKAQTGTLVQRPRLGRLLIGFGGVYLLGSLGRVLIGLAVPGAPEWFRTWIPAAFHLVLAAFLLTLAAYHRLGVAENAE